MNADDGVRQKILVTGGSGTLGFNILKRLAADEQYQVVAPLGNTQSGAVQTLSDTVQFIQHDLSDGIHTAQIFETEEDPLETLDPFGASKTASDLMLQSFAAESASLPH